MNVFEDNPKKLFIIDGVGALVSAFFLGVVLVKFESFFGIPQSALYVLAIIPCFFFIYDLISFKSNEEKTGRNLKAIALLNMAYVFLSIGMSVYHFQSIKVFGWIYIIGEILILLFLIRIEYQVGSKHVN